MKLGLFEKGLFDALFVTCEALHANPYTMHAADPPYTRTDLLKQIALKETCHKRPPIALKETYTCCVANPYTMHAADPL